MQIKEYHENSNSNEKLLQFLYSIEKDFFPPISTYGPLKEYLDFNIKKGKILYIEENNEIVGFIGFFLKPKKYDCPYIRTVAILKKYRGKGFGKFLLKSCLNFVKERKYSRVVLTTWSKNEEGIKLYKNLNFHIRDVLKDDRGKGIDTYIFEAQI